MENKILEIVDEICAMKSTNCRGLNKRYQAKKLLEIAKIPHDAIIFEIPLDWNRQVIILFNIPDNDYHYELFAGIGLDGKFYFELSEVGKNNYYYMELNIPDKKLPIDYFEKGIKA